MAPVPRPPPTSMLLSETNTNYATDADSEHNPIARKSSSTPAIQVSSSTTSQITLDSNTLASQSGPESNTLQPPSSMPENNPRTKSKAKKNKRFLSKILSKNRNKDEENIELGKDRDEGWNANVFGYLANFPTAPKYIWVRAHHKKQREFNRLFLAQELKCSIDADPGAKKATAWCARFSLDGKYLATAGADNIVRIWQVISTPEERDFYSDDLNGDDVETTGRSRRSSILRQKTKKVSAPVFLPFPIREYVGHTQDVLDLSWSKNNFLLSSSMDKSVRLWHLKMPESIAAFMHSDFVTSIAFHPSDDRFFLSGSLDCKLRLWSIPEKKVAYITRAPDLIMAVAFTPNGKTAIAGCFGGQCLFYETDGLTFNNQMVVKSSHGKNSNGSKITGIEVINYPNPYRSNIDSTRDYRLLISTNDSRVRLYNFDDRTLMAKFKGHENSEGLIRATFSDTGAYAISGSEDDRTYIWRVRHDMSDTSKTNEDYEYFHSNNSVVTVTLFAPHATRRLIYESRDPIYDIADPPPVILTRPSAPFVDQEQMKSASSSIHSGTNVPVNSYKVNPYDGNIIIAADQDGLIKVFRQDSAYERRKLHMETANNIQKKKISGITLSPTPSTRSNLNTALSIRGLSPRASTRRIPPENGQSPRLMPESFVQPVGDVQKLVNPMSNSPMLAINPDSVTNLNEMVHARNMQRSASPSSMSSLDSTSNARRLNRLRTAASASAAAPHAGPLMTRVVQPTGGVNLGLPVAVTRANADADLDDDVIRCKACGSNDFRARTTRNGTVALLCTNCKTIQTS